ncbi:putative conjugal transfer protein [Pelotomaculum schinkii]|uniref:Putative conjugal transfer protein n=1 Tax=Pelotomaculum schinkii TaxID=78350 RepID=A0A4Y7R6X4_9FIRM|nr:ATPase, T2SS/T4P/T4SS family [Pelotomaculum schinkii]TEB04698.1 putative conjugal transfer protein [Pelotomaculum schinkii]
MLSEALLNQIRTEIFIRLSHQNPLALQDLSISNNWEAFRRTAETVLTDRLFSEEKNLINKALDEIMLDPYGWGPVRELLNNKSVNNIWIKHNEIMYESEQGRQRWENVFQSEEHLRKTAERIALASGRRLDEANPAEDCRLYDGSRVSIVVPQPSTRGTAVIVRKFPRLFTLEELAEKSLFPARLLPMLKLMVKSRLNIFAAGAMGSGKNTFLNALLLCVGKDEILIFIENPAESRVGLPDPERPDLPAPFVYVYEPRPANPEGKGEVSEEKLFEKALRQQPDRLMVSECRNKTTAKYTLMAMNLGHSSMSSTHADGPKEVPTRLAELLGGDSRDSLAKTTAVEVVFFLAPLKEDEGLPIHRRLMDICEIRKRDDGLPEVVSLFSYHMQGWEKGMPVGELLPTGIKPSFLQKRKLSIYLSKEERELLESFFGES